MVDMEKVKALTSILEERSDLDVREAVARNIHYLDGYESYLYKKEIEYLLETLDVEEEPPLMISERVFYRIRAEIFGEKYHFRYGVFQKM